MSKLIHTADLNIVGEQTKTLHHRPPEGLQPQDEQALTATRVQLQPGAVLHLCEQFDATLAEQNKAVWPHEVHIELQPGAKLYYTNFQHLFSQPDVVNTHPAGTQLTASPVTDLNTSASLALHQKIHLHLQKDSFVDFKLISLGGAAGTKSEASTKLAVYLEQPGAQVQGQSLSLFGGVQRAAQATVFYHQASNTTSSLLAKSVLSGEARYAFSCRQLIDRKAQLTHSQQKSQHLLLSPRARVVTAPELEVQADEVTAAHGTTVGPLDDEALFYLTTRGASQQQAGDLLTQAFVQDVLPPSPLAQPVAAYLQNLARV